ncbi:hypothetical protein RD792_008367 [Penstemon davidsonii]|uniref:Two-component response regulator n=1 Tax=Penstemon davidsonii TaxID=160366 RepID=A0ABR0D9V9_9LAMI|nr:hypothetical protein RD792_008367 [Penstemon davidsonii]
MGSSGFSSPRSDYFPAGLRVLVVDDDPTWLKILEKMLKKCNYEGSFFFFSNCFFRNVFLFTVEKDTGFTSAVSLFVVTICNLAQEALDLLRERKDGFDLVISDVNMPDMDGFKLLELVGLEMDLPVIMMSVDGETSRVMKGVQHGACDYLLKPIRMKELRNIWQHVYRKRMQEVRDIEGHESIEELYMMRNGTEKSSDDGYLFSGGDPISGRKRKDSDIKSDSSSAKKSRLVWTVDLHQKFVKAVNQIGLDKVGPKKVRDLMGVSWITRENVASHLQKYRLYLSRLQKENEVKATGNVCLQNSTILQNESNAAAGNVKSTLPMPMTESKKALYGDVIDPPKTNTSGISFGHYLGPKSEAKIQNQYSWGPGVSLMQFKQGQNPHFQSGHMLDSVHPRPSIKEPGIQGSYGKSRSQGIEQVTQVQSHLTNSNSFGQIPCSMWGTKNHNLDQYMFDYLESSSQRNSIHGTGSSSASRLWDEEFNSFSSRGLNAINLLEESIGCSNQEFVPHVSPHLFDSLNLDCEYPCDPVEYPMMDQGLHIL